MADEGTPDERTRKRSKYKCYLSHSSPYSVAPRRSQKNLKTKVIDNLSADRPGRSCGEFSGSILGIEGSEQTVIGEIACKL